MKPPEMNPDFRDNTADSCFEALVEGRRIAMSQYRLQPGRVSFVHTETDPEYGGRGIATRLVRYALDTCRGRGLDVYPYCPFVRAFMEEHSVYLDLVPVDARERFGLV